MNGFLQRLNLLAAWPIWAKLLVGFVLVGVVPIVVLLLFTLSSIRAIGTENIESFLSETTNQEAQAVGGALAQINSQMQVFVNNSNNFERLIGMLPGQRAAIGQTLRRVELITLFQNQLVNTGNTLNSLELLDTNANVIMNIQAAGIISTVNNEPRTNAAAYLQGVQASFSNENSVLAMDVDASQQPLFDLVYILRTQDDTTGETITAGFLVARLNTEQIVGNRVTFGGQFLNSTTLMVNRRGFVMDQAGARFVDTLPVDVDILDQALAENSQFEEVEINGETVLRYYTRVGTTPLVLVRQANSTAVSSEVINTLIARVFVLVIGIGSLITVLVLLGNQFLSSPIQMVSHAIQAMSRGNYNAPLPDVHRGDEIGELSGNFSDMRQQVLDMIRNMEQRIEERARDVAATRDISRAAATQRDVQQLMAQVVELIVERFDNIYHAQIFLLDADRRYAVLRASTGEPGRQLLERGHRLSVGSVSVIGRVTGFGETVIARNTSTSNFHRHNEFLRETLSELAIPLRVANQVFGALDVQSRQSDSFTSEQTQILETMADQIAVAIESARLYTESLRRLDEMERIRHQTTLETWHQYMRNERRPYLESTAGTVTPTQALSAIRKEALEHGQVVAGDVTERDTIPLAVPIRLRGQLLGVVEWEVPQAEFDENKLLLAQDLTDQLAVNLDNARLFQETQRRTVREQLVNEVSTTLTMQNDLDQILQTAVREVGRVLQAPQVSIRLKSAANGHYNGEHK